MLGISCAGQLPVQTSSGAAAAAGARGRGQNGGGEQDRQSDAASSSRRWPSRAAAARRRPDAPTDEVFAGVVARGTAQDVHCEPVDAEVRGEPVVACSFEEERNASGAMRAVDRCFVVREGVLIDVTREVPVGTSCAVTSP